MFSEFLWGNTPSDPEWFGENPPEFHFASPSSFITAATSNYFPLSESNKVHCDLRLAGENSWRLWRDA
jgi:hypothetical protein